MSNPTTATTEIYLLSLHDAFRSGPRLHEMCVEDMDPHRLEHVDEADEPGEVRLVEMRWREVSGEQGKALREVVRLRYRKSTRLNSSHANISYAVLCSKKKIHVHS